MFKCFIMLLMVSPILFAESLAEQTGYFATTTQVSENIWIGAQPTEQDFSELATQGIQAVINTRTAVEMQQLPFNQTEQTSKYNMTYDLLEIGKGHAYSPTKLMQFNRLMSANFGKKMLLHCRSGNRITQLYTAWLIKYRHHSDTEALKVVGSDETLLNDAVNTLLGRPTYQ